MAATLAATDLLPGPRTGPARPSVADAAASRLSRQGIDPREARRAVDEAIQRAQNDPSPLLHLLDAVAARSLVLEGGLPRRRTDPLTQRISRLLEPDPLAIALLTRSSSLRGDATWPAGLARARSPRFDDLVDAHVAETHLHLGGGVPTALLWVDLLANLFDARGAFLRDVANGDRTWLRGIERAVEAMREVLVALNLPARSRPWEASAPPRIRGAPPGLDDVAVGMVGYGPLLGERRLLAAGLYELRRRTTHPDPAQRRTARDLEAPLRRWIEVRNAFHEAFAYGPEGRGLARFQESFGRRAFHAGGRSRSRTPRMRALERRRCAMVVDAVLADAALRVADPPPNPRAPLFAVPRTDLELRVTLDLPGRWRTQLRAWSEATLDTLQRWGGSAGEPELRVGFVHHFLRTADPSSRAGQAALARLQVQAGAFPWVERAWPGISTLLVGLDGASVETAGSPRDYAGVFLRAADGKEIPRLGRTWHAGEDFNDLLTGLRRVDESMWLLAIDGGGRLGHALALGWDAASFYAAAPQAPTYAEHALDLLWARARLSSAGYNIQAATVTQRLENLAATLNYRGSPPERVLPDVSLWQPDARPPSESSLLEQLGLPSEVRPLQLPIRNPDVWRDQQTPLVALLQQIVRDRARESGAIIEANPTSNLMVGRFADYADLPCVTLAPLGAVDGLPVSLNSDDPGMFLSWVRNEHIVMAEALAARFPRREQAIRDWLQRARDVGVRSTFLRLRPIPFGGMGNALLTLLGQPPRPRPPLRRWP